MPKSGLEAKCKIIVPSEGQFSNFKWRSACLTKVEILSFAWMLNGCRMKFKILCQRTVWTQKFKNIVQSEGQFADFTWKMHFSRKSRFLVFIECNQWLSDEMSKGMPKIGLEAKCKSIVQSEGHLADFKQKLRFSRKLKFWH
jgi:hypothetical protein